MIATVYMKCNAAHPDEPLNPMVAFQDSPSSVRIVDVPRRIGTWEITSVQVKAKFPDGSITARECVRVGNVWVATLAPSAVVGSCANGFVIGASGIDEHGDPVNGYILGVGDVNILPVDSSIHPGLTGHAVTVYDSEPTDPKIGDAYWDGEALKIFFGEWETIGGGIKVEKDVENNRTVAFLAATDVNAQKAELYINAVGSNDALMHVGDTHGGRGILTVANGPEGQGVARFGKLSGSIKVAEDGGMAAVEIEGNLVYDSLMDEYSVGAGSVRVNGEGASIQKNGLEVATEDKLCVTLELVDEGGAYVVYRGIDPLTFAEVKRLAETCNTVIRHGRGTYRATYIGQSEMVWDCTGTIQGAVKTGMIHMFADSEVVQLVEARELALKSSIGAPLEITGEYEDGETFSFNVLTKGA